jgi:hypothetical protein
MIFGEHCFDHGPKCCYCGFTPPEPGETPGSSKSDFIRCRCDHYQMNHRASTEGGCRNCACEAFRVLSHEPAHKKCAHGEHPFEPFQGPKDEPGKPHCLTCGHGWGECSWHWVDEAPPLTPEEEEEALPVEDWHCMHERGCTRLLAGECLHGCRDAADELSREANEPPPPQPLRRPPYAVAYSVGGHLYEVALPGDATVQAVDGALIIQHALGPVAGITQVLPIESKEAS